jgi:hypothetical protein
MAKRTVGLELKSYLNHVAESVLLDGFVSKKAALEGGDPNMRPTAEVALENMRLNKPVSEMAEKLAAFTQQWVSELPTRGPGNDFEHKLFASFENPVIDHTQIGMVAAGVGLARRAQDAVLNEIPGAPATAAEHVGEVGNTYVLELTVTKISQVRSAFGTTWMHRFVDAAGNGFSWFASIQEPTMEEGRQYKVQAIVKSHDEFRGTKVTMLKRVKRLN